VDLNTALRTLKKLVREHYPSLTKDQQAGAGVDAYVDAGDLGTDPEAYKSQNAQSRSKEPNPQQKIISGRIAPEVATEVSVKA
jgi:hypothetical protein